MPLAVLGSRVTVTAPSGVRVKLVPSVMPAGFVPLTGARTYYVRPDGSDSNTGTANTAAAAWRTLQKAMDFISSSLDLGPWDVTVQVADGTYTAGLVLKSYRATSGIVRFVGNTGAPASCTIAAPSGNAVHAAFCPGRFCIEGFRLQATAGFCLYGIGSGVVIDHGAIDFSTNANGYVLLQFGVLLRAVASFTVSSGAIVGFWAQKSVYLLAGRTITYLNSPVITAYHYNASYLGYIEMFGCIFINGGTVTGVRYLVHSNSVIMTNGGGASYIPGSLAGSAAIGGQYI